MKAHEMTEAEALELQHEMAQWSGSAWHIGKPVTKASFAATHPTTSQSSNEEYENDQQALAARHEREFNEMIRQDALKYRKEADTETKSSKE